MLLIAIDDEQYALKDLSEAICEAVPQALLHKFRSHEKALAFSRQNEIAVAFLDIEMGVMSGLEIAKKLKDINKKTNIVFVTGHSQYALDAFSLHVSGYILKPVSIKAVKEAMENLRNPIEVHDANGSNQQADNRLRAQAFGNFEVFIDGRLLYFKRSKAKELFALLIHKQGSGCTSKEIAAMLFENQVYNVSLQKQVQTIISSMVKTFTEIGMKNVIIRNYNSIAVDVSRITCDYYNFLNWDLNAINRYMGEYMLNYSWAEFTINQLDKKLTK